jgi:hypothetical protein
MAVLMITNASTGSQDLVINNVTILGDPECAFEFDLETDLVQQTIPPGESSPLRVRFAPDGVGEHHAGLRIRSNAQNYPQMDLWVCGRATESPPWLHPPGPFPDQGTEPDADAGGLPDLGVHGFFCRDPGETVAACSQ